MLSEYDYSLPACDLTALFFLQSNIPPQIIPAIKVVGTIKSPDQSSLARVGGLLVLLIRSVKKLKEKLRTAIVANIYITLIKTGFVL